MRILIFLSCLYPLQLFSQDRVNKELPVITIDTNHLLTSATGWLLDEQGQWISRPNRIPVSVGLQNESLQDVSTYAIGNDNFKEIGLHDIIIEGKPYKIMIKKTTTGQWKYPAIKKDWENEETIIYWVFEQKNMNQKSIPEKKQTVIDIPLICWGSVPGNQQDSVNNKRLIGSVSDNMKIQIKNTKSFLTLILYKNTETDLFRFLILGTLVSGRERLPMLFSNIQDPLSVMKLYQKGKLLENMYYEVNSISFYKLLPCLRP